MSTEECQRDMEAKKATLLRKLSFRPTVEELKQRKVRPPPLDTRGCSVANVARQECLCDQFQGLGVELFRLFL